LKKAKRLRIKLNERELGNEYDVTNSRSFDGGKTWDKPFIPHHDGVKTEHGFVSLFAAKDGSLAAVWLDGREMKPAEGGHDHGQGNMTLRYVKIKRDGALVDGAALDTRVCAGAFTSHGMAGTTPAVTTPRCFMREGIVKRLDPTTRLS